LLAVFSIVDVVTIGSSWVGSTAGQNSSALILLLAFLGQ
jgi:hypothetical protein